MKIAFPVHQIFRIANENLPHRQKQTRPEYQFPVQYRIFFLDDSDMWIRLGLIGKIVYIDEVNSQYIIHSGNTSRDIFKIATDNTNLNKINIIRLQGLLSDREMDCIQTRLANCYADAAWALRCEKKGALAAQAYLKCLQTKPRWLALLFLLRAWLPVNMRERA